MLCQARCVMLLLSDCFQQLLLFKLQVSHLLLQLSDSLRERDSN